MRNSKEKFTHTVSSKKEFIDQVLRRQQQIAKSFIDHKDTIHENEDPKFLDSLSDILDIRNWNMKCFDPDSDANKDDEAFQGEVQIMLQKLRRCDDFCCDLDMDKLADEMKETLLFIYDSERISKNLGEAKQKMHIIDQWTYLRGSVVQFSENFQPLCLVQNRETKCCCA